MPVLYIINSLNIMFIKRYSFLLLVGGLSTNAMAGNLWMDCGIGHWIAGSSLNGFPALSTNMTWDLGTTATLSQVTTPGSCSGPFHSAARFIQMSYPMIEQDTALGGGEHLYAALDYFDCSVDTNNKVITNMRSDLYDFVTDRRYANLSNSQKAEKYYNQLANYMHSNSNNCSAI